MMAVPARATVGIKASARSRRFRIAVSYANGCCRDRLDEDRYRTPGYGWDAARFAFRQLVLAGTDPKPLCSRARLEPARSMGIARAEVPCDARHHPVVLHRLLD